MLECISRAVSTTSCNMYARFPIWAKSSPFRMNFKKSARGTRSNSKKTTVTTSSKAHRTFIRLVQWVLLDYSLSHVFILIAYLYIEHTNNHDSHKKLHTFAAWALVLFWLAIRCMVAWVRPQFVIWNSQRLRSSYRIVADDPESDMRLVILCTAICFADWGGLWSRGRERSLA